MLEIQPCQFGGKIEQRTRSCDLCGMSLFELLNDRAQIVCGKYAVHVSRANKLAVKPDPSLHFAERDRRELELMREFYDAWHIGATNYEMDNIVDKIDKLRAGKG